METKKQEPNPLSPVELKSWLDLNAVSMVVQVEPPFIRRVRDSFAQLDGWFHAKCDELTAALLQLAAARDERDRAEALRETFAQQGKEHHDRWKAELAVANNWMKKANAFEADLKMALELKEQLKKQVAQTLDERQALIDAAVIREREQCHALAVLHNQHELAADIAGRGTQNLGTFAGAERQPSAVELAGGDF